MKLAASGVYVVLFGVMYWALDSFERTRDFTHVEYALRIGTTGLQMYMYDNIDTEVLNWLSLISAGYYLWHVLRAAIVDRSAVFGWKYIAALCLSLVAVHGYIPPGIMLMFALLEVPSIFSHATQYMAKNKPAWVGGKFYTFCDVAFFATWMYYRVWVALPVISRFAFSDDVWHMRTPPFYVRTVQLCVLILVAIHVILTWRLLLRAKAAFSPTKIDRYHHLLKRLVYQ